MGPAPGRPLPPPPKTTPAGDAPAASSSKPCVACQGRPCTNPVNHWTEYGCWCGGDIAPARDAGLEGQIPQDESTWSKWVDDNNLPRPLDGTDNCCMKHDLELGKLRQTHPDLGYNSKSPLVAAINHRLAQCFAQHKNDQTGGWFAWRGEKAMNHLVENDNGGLGAMSGAAESQSLGTGFGNVGMGGADTGAFNAFMGP